MLSLKEVPVTDLKLAPFSVWMDESSQLDITVVVRVTLTADRKPVIKSTHVLEPSTRNGMPSIGHDSKV